MDYKEQLKKQRRRQRLNSFGTEEEAISVLRRAQQMLAASNLRLHKISFNRPAVIEAFPPEDRSKDVGNLDLFTDDLPVQPWIILGYAHRHFHIPN